MQPDAVHSMDVRIANVAACQYVDEVIPVAGWVFDPAMIEKYNIDLVVHGDDYSDEKQQLMYKVPIEMGIFRTVTYTKGISTTKIIHQREQSKIKGALEK